MKPNRYTLLCATMLMGVGAVPALAAETAAPNAPAAGAETDAGTSSEDIVVTGNRRATTLQDAPINISAVGSDELGKQRIDDAKGLAAFTPGLTVRDTGPTSAGDMVLRGISSSDADATGSNGNTSIGVYLGEVPLYYDFKLLDISRVEVLQGPQGTLYGLGTLAGAVRYMPNRPNTDRWSIDGHGRFFTEAQSQQLGVNGDVTVNVPIIRDHVALRSTVGYYSNPGFIDYDYLLKQPGISDPQPVRSTDPAKAGFGTTADYAKNFSFKRDVNYEHTFTTRNQLLLEANPGLKLYLTFAHQETTTGGRQANGAGVLGTGNYVGPWRYLEPIKRKADLYAAEFNIDLFHFAQLVSTTAFTNQQIDTSFDNTDLLLDLNYGYEAFPNFSSYNQATRKVRQFNEEIRFVSTHGGPLSWVIGGFYNNLRNGNNYQEHVPGFAAFAGVNRPDDLEYISFVNTRTKEKAAYGEATFHVTPAWQITGGLRYFQYDAFATGGTDTPMFAQGLTNTPYPLIQFAPSRIKSGNTSSTGTVWKANTSYKFSPELLVYATYSTGYRTGNVNRVAPCTFTPDNVPPGQNVCAYPNELIFTPDKTRNAEIGVRAALFDRRLQFTLSAFHVDWKNIQVDTVTVNGAVGVTINAKDAVSKGFEFTGQAKITPELVLQGTYSYTDAHLIQDAKGIVVSQGQSYDVFAGDRLPGSTKNSGSLGLTYTHKFGEGRSIEANWTTTYIGEIYSRIGLRGNGEKIPGYVTHRVALTYHAPSYDISLFGDNIFNKYAVTGVSNDVSSFNQIRDAFGTAPPGVVERYYARSVLTPRRLGVDIRFHY